MRSRVCALVLSLTLSPSTAARTKPHAATVGAGTATTKSAEEARAGR